MTRTIESGTLIGIVDAVWLPGEGLWLGASEWRGSVHRLRSMLLGWHTGSWYGERAASRALAGIEGIVLPALAAVDYMDEPRPVKHLAFEWSPRAKLLQQAAAWIRRALLSGWYAPDLASWAAGKFRWRAAVPDGMEHELAAWRGIAAEGERHGIRDLERWLSDAAEEAVAADPDARGAFERMLAKSGADLSAKAAADEEEWLVQIGWKPDETPFRTALQLLEPEGEADDGEGWRLAVVVLERSADGKPIRVEPDGEGGWQAAGGERAIPESWRPWLLPKLEKEQTKWEAALPSLAEPGTPRIRLNLTEDEAWHFLREGSGRLLQAGCPVILPSWWEAVRKRRTKVRAKVKSMVGSGEQPLFGLNQIVAFDWRLAVGDRELTEEQFIRLAEDGRRLLRLDGEWVQLDPADVRLIRTWLKQRNKNGGMTLSEVMEWHLRGGSPLSDEDDAAGPEAEIELNRHLTAWLERLQNVSELPRVAKPAAFRGELRPYQEEGVSWLAFLRQFGLGGCLADDMGLGKTVQFTAYLLHVSEQSGGVSTRSSGPSLLICPTSVIGNWEKELERFAPSLRVHLHYGPRRAKGDSFAETVRDADLVITSYALAPLDESELGSVEWDTLCLDEAQNIKNIYTKQTSVIRKLRARHRIAMTGTPMENRLTELWSIHDFINPGYLGPLAEFRREVVIPVERERDEQAIRRLQRWVKPFMLRRVKQDPAIQLELPDKAEHKHFVTLTAEQGALYERTVNELLEGLDGRLPPMKRRGLILAALTKLKQLCDHPSLVLGDAARGPASFKTDRSVKLMRLLEMTDEIAAEGERCLIFTQFVDMGEAIRRKLEERLGMPVPYLHGGVSKHDRDTMIAEFQNLSERRCAFVLSLKAGGTGLNLTAANHVFHFDRWWNPAVENQATDRAFRIGQTKNVQVHKFVALGTLEERIDDMLTRKQRLNEQVVTRTEGWITELDRDELRALFALRRSWAYE